AIAFQDFFIFFESTFEEYGKFSESCASLASGTRTALWKLFNISPTPSGRRSSIHSLQGCLPLLCTLVM
ncbi:Hypothetical predicted protein, partial [Olea europaea subsp. europaea]